MEYNNTPIASLGVSPNELYFGRLVKSKLPAADGVLKRKLIEESMIKDKISEKRSIQKKYYDKGTKELKELEIGERVMFKIKKQDKEWRYGTVHRVEGNRSYVIRDKNDRYYRRNRIMIKCTFNTENDVDEVDYNVRENNIESYNEQRNNTNANGNVIELQDNGSPLNQDRNQDRVLLNESVYESAESDLEEPNEPITFRTRGGRSIRPPRYLSDYDLS